jgi:Lon protease-like protein
MLTANKPLPLFPLNTVLFPRMTLPLRIFEPRYRQMLADCLDDDPILGVVLIKEGKEVGGPAMPHDVGTTARIIAVQKKSMELHHVTTVGEERFRLRRILRNSPYLVGEIEPFPLEAVDALGIEALAERGTALLATYLKLLSRTTGAEIKLQHPPDDPEKIAYLIAMALQVTLPEKQRLLTIPDLPTLLRQEISLLRNETKVLSVMIHAQESKRGGESPNEAGETFLFSKN